MRCKFCGWNNPDHVNVCVKCGKPTGIEAGTPDYVYSGDISDDNKKTERFRRDRDVAHSTEKRHCPNCSYPVLKGMTVCPQCKYELGQEDFQMLERKEQQSDSAAASENKGENPDKKTINPYFNKKKQDVVVRKISLTPIKREDEVDGLKEIEFSGDMISLNRQNTEPDNVSITGKTQAVMTFENGCWNIQDKSAQRTTFVQAAQNIPLKDGDIILLGNRMFVFHESK